VYITPENLIENPLYRNMLLSKKYKEKLVALVVDEAHCIKMWGDEFRKAFMLIGNLRSVIPTGVNVMALTATATTETYHCALKHLAMKDTVLVAVSPDRNNIRYSIKPAATLEMFSNSLSSELRSSDKPFPKTVVFIRKYRDCSDLYALLRYKLGSSMTDPPGYPNVSKYRRVDMYHRVLTTRKKEKMLATFCSKDSVLRVIIATSAFGLGVDCEDIQSIIHWGLPNTIEEYVQEAGRAGRDGRQAEAILYRGKVGRKCSKSIRMYESSDSCRRHFLFNPFLCYFERDIAVSGCLCCDVCAVLCSCVECEIKSN
jgi:bloom syndrome protein